MSKQSEAEFVDHQFTTHCPASRFAALQKNAPQPLMQVDPAVTVRFCFIGNRMMHCRRCWRDVMPTLNRHFGTVPPCQRYRAKSLDRAVS
jgi:hypothetical protein